MLSHRASFNKGVPSSAAMTATGFIPLAFLEPLSCLTRCQRVREEPVAASALILADLLLSHSALSCLTAQRRTAISQVACSNLPSLAVSNLASAIAFLPATLATL